MSLSRHLFVWTALAALTSGASAQGNDACATAQGIAGTGSFVFDNSLATTGVEGQLEVLCYFFGSSSIDNDVWFSWIAPADGTYTLDTCGTTAVDTKVSVYSGSGCPTAGTSLACNDDACGLQSEVSWSALAGQTFTLQVGTFPGAAGGTGSINISDNLPVQDPIGGHHYQVIDQPGLSWDQARVAASNMVFQGMNGHLVTINDASEDAFVQSLGGVHWHWTGGFQNTLSPLYAEPAGGWEWVTGEPMTYTNWNQAIPEPNNNGACASEDFLELIENVGGVPYGWNDACPTEHPAGFVVEFETGGGSGYCFGDGTSTACPCGNVGGADEGCANSSGAGATLAMTGSTGVAADDLGFTAGQLIPSQPVLLFSGVNAVNGGAGILFGDGLRCAGGNIVRLGVRVPDAAGGASWGPGMAAAGGWVSGDTRRFQAWYRDPVSSPCGANFNLSHGVELVFGP